MQRLTHASRVPESRIRVLNAGPVSAGGDYVLYCMTANRRSGWNFALQRAVEWCVALRKPLLVLEPLRCDHPWACDRFHTFVIAGMADQAARFGSAGLLYYPFVESRAHPGKGLVAALTAPACVAVMDMHPGFFHPRMVEAAAAQAGSLRVEEVDCNGLVPVLEAGRVFPTAHAFRRHLQKTLRPHLYEFPDPDPLQGVELPEPPPVARDIAARWPPLPSEEMDEHSRFLSRLPIDHAVGPTALHGGSRAATRLLQDFLDHRLPRYLEARNDPDEDVSSGLSPYLHFGHISAHQAFFELALREGWTPERLAASTSGSRNGWWGLSPAAEAFVDQLVTWRELGFNMCAGQSDYDNYESLPAWARQTLQKHAPDVRAHEYTQREFEAAATHDPLWNAAQRQLVVEGRIHNYLRMLWGKKILEWSLDPGEALECMIHLNNKYALDGRDPNSYSGIFWILGRYDRAWGPERPIFGTVRYMSSENTARKLHVTRYVRKYSHL